MTDAPKSMADVLNKLMPPADVPPQPRTMADVLNAALPKEGVSHEKMVIDQTMLEGQRPHGPRPNVENSALVDDIGMRMFPKDATPANHFEAVKVLSEHFTFMPTSGNASRQLKALSDIQAVELMESMGLPADNVDHAELFKKLRGTMLMTNTLIDARLTAEEVGPVFSRINKTLGSQIMQKAQAALYEQQRRIDDLQAKQYPGAPISPQLQAAREEGTKLAEALSAGRSMVELSDDPQMQAIMLDTMKTRGVDRADASRNETEAMRSAVIQDIFSIGIGDVFPEMAPASYGKRNELAKRMRSAIDLVVNDPTDYKASHALLTNLANGELRNQRLSMLGVPENMLAEAGQDALPFFLNPALMEDIALAKAREAAKLKLGTRSEKVTPEGIGALAKDIAPSMREVTARQLLYGGERSYLDTFRTRVRLPSADTALADRRDQALRLMGDIYDLSVDVMDKAAGMAVAPLMWKKFFEDKEPVEGDLLAMKRATAAIIGHKVGAQKADEASDAGDEVLEAYDILTTTGSASGGGTKRVRITGTKLNSEVAHDLLNPEGGLLRDIGAAMWPELAPQVLERVADLGLDPAAFRHLYAKRREEYVDEGLARTMLTGTDDETAQRAFTQYMQTLAKRQTGRASFHDMLRDSWAAGIAALGQVWRGTLKSAINKPEELIAENVYALGFGFGGHAIIKKVGETALADKFVTGAMMKRAIKVLDKAIVDDPHTVKVMKDFAEGLIPNAPAERLKLLQDTVDTLDALQRRNRLDPTSANPSKPLQSTVDSLRNEVRDAARVVETFAPEEVSALLSDLKLSDTVREWITNPNRLEVMLQVLGRDVTKIDTFGRVRKHMDIQSKLSQQDVAVLVQGHDYLDVTDLPVSPLQLKDPSARNLWGKIVPGAEKGATLAKLVDFVAERSALLRAGKFRNAQNRANTELLLDVVESSQRARLHDVVVAERMLPDIPTAEFDANQARLINNAAWARTDQTDKLVQRAKKALDDAKQQGLPTDNYERSLKSMEQAHQNALTHATGAKANRDYHEKILFEARTLERTRASILAEARDASVLRQALKSDPTVAQRVSRTPVFDNLSVSKTLTALSARRPNTRREIFLRMRKGGETMADFDMRVADIISKEAAGTDIEDVARFQKALHREFLDSENVGSVYIGGNSGPTRQGTSVVVNERLLAGLDATTRKKVEDLLGKRGKKMLADPDIHTKVDFTADLEDMNRIANSSKAMRSLLEGTASPGTSAYLLSRLVAGINQLDDHTGATKVKVAKHSGISMALTSRVLTDRVGLMTRTFNNLHPDAKRLLVQALDIQDELGINLPLQALRNDPRFKGFFRYAAPDHDQAVHNLLTDMTQFRADVLDSAKDAGLITQQQWLRMMRPYASNRFGAHQRHQLKGIGGATSKAVDVPTREGEIRPGEFVTERAKDRWKVAVRNDKGGGEFEHLFETQAEAEEFAMRNFNTLEGQGPSGEHVKVLEPITDQDFIDLEVLNRAGSTFEAMKDLAIDMERMKYIRSLNSDGAALTTAEKELLRQREREGKSGPFRASDYTKTPLPSNRRLYGEFAGKHVHKKMLAQIDTFTDGAISVRSIMEATTEGAEQLATFKRVLEGAKGGLMSLNKRFKQAITTMQIALSPAVIGANLLSDRLIFGRAAAGKGFNTTFTGMKAHADAWDILDKWSRGEIRLADMPDHVRFAFENNIQDDALFGLKTSINQDLYRAKTGAKKPGYVDSFKRAFVPNSDPEVKALAQRQKDILEILETESRPDRIADLNVEFDTISARIKNEDKRLSVAQAKAYIDNALDVILDEGGVVGDVSLTAQARHFYGKVSNSTRLAAYLYQVEKGVSPVVALERVNTFMQTYSRIPRFVKEAQKLPFVNPVVSFPYEAVRVMLNLAKEEPAFLAGMMAAAPALNSVSIAASGADPSVVMRALTRDTHTGYLPLEMMGTLVIPDREGHLTTVEIPGLNLFNAVLSGGPGGILGGAAQALENSGVDGFTSLLSRGAMRVAGSFLGNNPITGAATQFFGQKDVFGRKYADQGAAMADIGRNTGELFMPTWMPWVGKWHNRLLDSVHSGQYAYSDRTRDVVSTAMQAVAGIKVGNLGAGGGAADLLPKDFMKAASEALMFAVGIPPAQMPSTARRIWGEGGFQERDYQAMVFIDSARMDIDAPFPERPDNPLSREINAAARQAQDPDAVVAAYGEQRLAELKKDYEKRVATLRGEEEGTQEEAFLNQVTRFAGDTDLLERFNGYSMPRKAYILASYVRDGRTELFKTFSLAFLATDSGTVRSATRREAVARARNMLRDAVRVNPKALEQDPFLPVIMTLMNQNGPYDILAGVSEKEDASRDAQRRAALELIERSKQ